MITKKECCKQELTKKVDGVMVPYRCGRPSFKDGLCKSHHPGLIKARELISDLWQRRHSKEMEIKQQVNKVLTSMGESKLNESTAIALLVQLGYRVEKLGMDASIQAQPSLPVTPSAAQQELYKDKIDEPIDTLDFSVRCTNILKSNKILTIGDLMSCSLKQIDDFSYLKQTETQQIIAAMLALGKDFSNDKE